MIKACQRGVGGPPPKGAQTLYLEIERRAATRKMKDEKKTEKQLFLSELAELRQRIAELEKVETERKQVEEALAHERNSLRALMDSHRDNIFFDENPSNQLRYLDVIASQRVDGVIVAPYDSDTQNLAKLPKRISLQ